MNVPPYPIQLRRGHIYTMVGEAVMHMKFLKRTRTEVDELRRRVQNARGRAEQLAVLREWFRVEEEE